MAIITVRVPEDLKRRMEQLPELNWSEVMRRAVERRVSEEIAKRREHDGRRLRQAAKTQDQIAKRLSFTPAGSWKSLEVIRYWREHRYSS